MELLFATANAGKLREVAALLEGEGVKVLGLGDLEEPIEVVEDGNTFIANARKKASTLHAASGLAVLADDSGLCVEALGGAPGVHSARYAGPEKSDAANMEKLLKALSGQKGKARAAHFLCSMVFISKEGVEVEAEGILNGEIALAHSGDGGFGYDPIFIPEGERRTLAEHTMDEKNKISHRKRALSAILPLILPHLK
ncbi:MAG: non-canonical purine NTP pyrophosphatase, RdgB/HAM1 family [Deltaproteobacteria bacterium]|nr:MAG: non-canonical purine NTP pyrophosphatase, RdgB/HAM1 family [Deltaproteobacteria bacterium]